MDKIVVDLAQVLNVNHILWGIGGSYLLKSYGILEDVHDLDILVSEKDIDRTLEILDSIGERKTIPVKKEYLTRHFHVFLYKGLSIDIMSGFRISHPDGVYEYILDDKAIVKREIRQGVSIPFTSLEDWLIAYKLMKGRQTKVEMIENYLHTYGIGNLDQLKRNLSQDLPEEIKLYIEKLLANN